MRRLIPIEIYLLLSAVMVSCTVEPIRIDVRGQSRSQSSEPQSNQPSAEGNQAQTVWVPQATGQTTLQTSTTETGTTATNTFTNPVPSVTGQDSPDSTDSMATEGAVSTDMSMNSNSNNDPNQMMMADPNSNNDPNQMMMADPNQNMDPPLNNIRILIFSKTAGYRHGSIGAGRTAIEQLVAEHNNQGQFQIAIDMSEDSAEFTETNLARYAAVIFLSTTGNLFNSQQKSDFESYIRDGGGFVGIHSATDTEYNWAWYGRLVGAFFDGHPNIQNATLRVENPSVPATAPYSATFTRTDEWYNFQPNPRQNGVRVLLTLDESTYSGGQMGNDHPIAWCHVYDGGRSFYTGGGHTNSSFSESGFRRHLFAGILFAAVGTAQDCLGMP